MQKVIDKDLSFKFMYHLIVQLVITRSYIRRTGKAGKLVLFENNRLALGSFSFMAVGIMS